ncbi:MAG: (2Fe-2S)-binding protein [Candidatus Micrarchaeota archaeon]|nr:(2Fe-2S)-binding protein [Candidatus Micrarchaeota archaeon]
MAKVKFPSDNIEADVPVGTPLKKVIEEQGANVHFACSDGRCGTCLVRIIKGMEFLNKRTPNEARTLEMLGTEDDKRLACQVVIEKDGTIEVEGVY